jgi:hypothetical protein
MPGAIPVPIRQVIVERHPAGHSRSRSEAIFDPALRSDSPEPEGSLDRRIRAQDVSSLQRVEIGQLGESRSAIHLTTTHGRTIVPSRRRSLPRFRPGEVYGSLAETFSSTSIPRPGLSFEYM